LVTLIEFQLASRREQQSVRENCERHAKELVENQQQLRSATIKARKAISRFHAYSAKTTTERLSDLLSKMGDRVAQSEQTMDSLIHSSSVLVQTHSEFESHAGHIKTGNKLLSKYERRELTDKILVAIALIFYFAVIYYILQKRILSKFWLW
uniref:Vesicle transport protein SEC20 n=1 Tax=Haemonchus placei TaxID=6290 RepID=A0A0N4WRC5_HAEPC